MINLKLTREAGRILTLWDLMKEFEIGRFMLALATIRNVVHSVNPAQPWVAMPLSTHERFKRDSAVLLEEVTRFGFTSSKASATRLRDLIWNEAKPHDKKLLGEDTVQFNNLHLGEILRAIPELELRLLDEFSSVNVVIISAEGAEMIKSRSQFPPIIYKQFPGLSYELDEAVKCYALDRSTASAMHSIRALEAGIRAISRCLNIPDPTKGVDRNWGQMLKTIKIALDAKWPTSADRLHGDGKTFERLHGNLAAIQNPYRNASMHLDEKYTSREAKLIMDIVAGIMADIAKRCDEDGKPLA